MVSSLRHYRRAAGVALLAGFALGLSTVSLPAQPRAEAEPGEEGTQSSTAPEDGSTATNVIAPLPALDDIDAILEGEDEVLSGGGYTYDPGGRRDPFKSLRISNQSDQSKGPRPEGIPGLLIDEILLSGIIRTRNGYMAQVQSADQQKSYLLKVGDQLFDGDVISINSRDVVFKQNVQDRTALKPFREVVKSLNP